VAKKLVNPRTDRAVDYYLHAILLLTDHGQPAETNDLAAKVGVSPAAASQMLKVLSKKKLVEVEPYQGARLSTEGLHRALRAIRRHRLVEVFLHKVMGFDLHECHTRARAMQGVVDRVFEDKLAEMLGHPKFDPHGSPIPGRDATWPKQSDAALLSLPPGTAGKLSRITCDDGTIVQYLKTQGFVTGAPVTFQSVAPFDGPVLVSVGGKPLHLGRRLAEVIYLEADPPLSSEHPPSRPPVSHRPKR